MFPWANKFAIKLFPYNLASSFSLQEFYWHQSHKSHATFPYGNMLIIRFKYVCWLKTDFYFIFLYFHLYFVPVKVCLYFLAIYPRKAHFNKSIRKVIIILNGSCVLQTWQFIESKTIINCRMERIPCEKRGKYFWENLFCYLPLVTRCDFVLLWVCVCVHVWLNDIWADT